MSIEQHYTELNKFSIISKALTMKLFNFQVSWINIRNPLSSFLSFMFYKTQNVVLESRYRFTDCVQCLFY